MWGRAAAREAADDNPRCLQGGPAEHGDTVQREAQEDCARVGMRDFDLERWGIEARADYRFAEDGTAIFTYGRTSANGNRAHGLGGGADRRTGSTSSSREG